MLLSFYDYAVIVTLSAWISIKFQEILDHNLTLIEIMIYFVDDYLYKRSKCRLLLDYTKATNPSQVKYASLTYRGKWTSSRKSHIQLSVSKASCTD